LNREDFLILKQDIIYFDNGATTLKPSVLAETISDYYNNYSANSHRGDYNLSLKVDEKYENTRKLLKKYINSKYEEEIIFTSGTTDSLNKVVFGYFRYNLEKGDEVLLNKSEHASNVLPWFELASEIGIIIKFVDLDNDFKLTLNNIKNAITSNTKVISFAHITNVIGDLREAKEITKLAHDNDMLVVMDAAQSIGHLKVDVVDLDVDFMAFSAHKMYGPTGVGVLYGKKELLKNIRPIIFGGGMNSSYDSEYTRVYSELPYLLEAGTQNIAGVIGFSSVIEYINKVGLTSISEYESNLKKYALEKISKVRDIIIYNRNSESPIITFNIKNIFAQDLAIYLNKYNICVRAGNHCSKILKEELDIKNTVRISLAFYNTKEEIDKLIEALSNQNIREEII